MCSSKTVGTIAICLGILVILICGGVNYYIFTSDETEFYSRENLVAAIESRQEMLPEIVKEEGKYKTSMTLLFLSTMDGPLIRYEFSNLYRILILLFDILIVTQVIFIIIWGIDKRNNSNIYKSKR